MNSQTLTKFINEARQVHWDIPYACVCRHLHIHLLASNTVTITKCFTRALRTDMVVYTCFRENAKYGTIILESVLFRIIIFPPVGGEW